MTDATATPPSAPAPSPQPIARRHILAAGAVALAATGPLGRQPAVATNRAVTEVLRASTLPQGTTSDDTTVLQALLDSTAPVVVIDDIGRDWITGPLVLNRDNVSIQIDPGVVIRAGEGLFPDLQSALLTLDARSNATISGYGAVIEMNKDEYVTGEWRHVISILSSSEVVVEGLVLSRSGGDGVYLGSTSGSSTPSTDVTLRDLVVHDNRRNGLSVISVNGLLVQGCAFTGTSGTNPQAGIDIEPNHASQLIQGILFLDCHVADNVRFPVHVNALKLAGTMDVTFDRTYVQNAYADTTFFVSWSDDHVLDGTVVLKNVLLDNPTGAGGLAAVRIPANAHHLVLEDLVAWNPNNNPGGKQLFQFRSYSSDSADIEHQYGGVNFDNVAAWSALESPSVQCADGFGGSARLIGGTLSVSNAWGVTTSYGANPAAITLLVNDITSQPSATVTVSSPSSISRGTTGVVTLSRSGSTAAPLAVRYEITGSARARYDYGGLSQAAIIPAGSASTQLQIRALPFDSTTVTAIVTVLPGEGYTGGATTTFSIV